MTSAPQQAELQAPISQIIDFFDIKLGSEYFAKSIDFKAVTQNDYKLSIHSYVAAKDNLGD
jgi:type I restriction enzyme M protein